MTSDKLELLLLVTCHSSLVTVVLDPVAILHPKRDARVGHSSRSDTMTYFFFPDPIVTIVSNSSFFSGITESCDCRISGRFANLLL